jgi:hypothetical protein
MSLTEVLTFIRNASPPGYMKDDFIITIYQNNMTMDQAERHIKYFTKEYRIKIGLLRAFKRTMFSHVPYFNTYSIIEFFKQYYREGMPYDYIDSLKNHKKEIFSNPELYFAFYSFLPSHELYYFKEQFYKDTMTIEEIKKNISEWLSQFRTTNRMQKFQEELLHATWKDPMKVVERENISTNYYDIKLL